jgi:hypothetical protein
MVRSEVMPKANILRNDVLANIEAGHRVNSENIA